MSEIPQPEVRAASRVRSKYEAEETRKLAVAAGFGDWVLEGEAARVLWVRERLWLLPLHEGRRRGSPAAAEERFRSQIRRRFQRGGIDWIKVLIGIRFVY